MIGKFTKVNAQILIILAGLVSFHNIFGNSFHYDDGHSIVDNENIRELGNIPSFFIDPGNFSALQGAEMYRPLLLCTYALNYAIGGYETTGYHSVNLVIHILNALLVFGLARRLQFSKYAQVFAGLFFVCHPLMTEPLNYISSRSSILVTLFGLIFFHAMLQKRFVLMTIGNTLALFCKATGIILPLIAIIWCRGQIQLLTSRKWWILAIPGSMYMLVNFSIVNSAIGKPVRDYGLQISTQIKAFVFYLMKTIFPHPLSIDPTFTISYSPSNLVVVCASSFLVSLLWIILFCRPPTYFKQINQIAGWYFLLLIPVSIIPLNILVNEHRLYMPMVSYAIILSMFFNQRRVRLYLGCLLCGIMIFLCIHRNNDWQTGVSIWSDAVAKGPEMYRPLVNLGKSLLESGEIDKSIVVSLQAVERSPTSPTAHFNLGTAYLRKENYNKARIHLEEAVKSSKALSQSDNNLAAVYMHLNEFEQALLIYRKLFITDPRIEFQHNIANAHLKIGNLDSAKFHFSKTIEMDFTHKEGYFGLFKGLCLEQNKTDAFELFEEVVYKWPNDYELLKRFLILLDKLELGKPAIEVLSDFSYEKWALYQVVGKVALAEKRWDEAYNYFDMALNISGKKDPSLLNNLGIALLGKQEEVAALSQFRRAIDIDRGYAEGYANIGRVLLSRKKFKDALSAIKYAIKIEPTSFVYWMLQGEIYEGLKDLERASRSYKKAANLDSNYSSKILETFIK